MRRQIFFFLWAAGLVVGCNVGERPYDRVHPEVPLWYNRPGNALHVFLRRTVTAPSRVQDEPYERGRIEVDPLHGRVFVGSSDQGLYALSAGDGSTLWRFETAGVVQCEPLYDPKTDTVFFGSHDGALYAVRAFDGKLLWRYNTGAEVVRRPTLWGDFLYVANAGDQLFALDPNTGQTRWQVQRPSVLGMEIVGYAAPTLDKGTVYIAFSDGQVAAYDALTGSEKWTVDLSAEVEQAAGVEIPRYLDVDTTPVVGAIDSTRALFVASYAGGVYALNAETGARMWFNDAAVGVTDLVLWREPAHRPSKVSYEPKSLWFPERKMVLASSGTSGLWALDLNTGKEIWRNKLPEGGVSTPVPVAGVLMVGTSRYGLFLLPPRTGRVIDGLDLGTGFVQTPAAHGQRIFAMSNAGTFLGIQVVPP